MADVSRMMEIPRPVWEKVKDTEEVKGGSSEGCQDHLEYEYASLVC